jgi:hypothetical protein
MALSGGGGNIAKRRSHKHPPSSWAVKPKRQAQSYPPSRLLQLGGESADVRLGEGTRRGLRRLVRLPANQDRRRKQDQRASPCRLRPGGSQPPLRPCSHRSRRRVHCRSRSEGRKATTRHRSRFAGRHSPQRRAWSGHRHSARGAYRAPCPLGQSPGARHQCAHRQRPHRQRPHRQRCPHPHEHRLDRGSRRVAQRPDSRPHPVRRPSRPASLLAMSTAPSGRTLVSGKSPGAASSPQASIQMARTSPRPLQVSRIRFPSRPVLRVSSSMSQHGACQPPCPLGRL